MEQLRSSNIKLSERQRQLLAIIVEEHVASARPVASEHIVSRYGLNISSATVRNDMVELERAGLIVQPHTSAGRVPSELGYRFFVANLMSPSALSVDEQRKIRHQFHQIESDAEEWVRLATSVLARASHTAAVATAPRSSAVRLKHFELLAISDQRMLIVLVADDGTVTQQMLTVEEGEEQEQERLSTLATRLNANLAGQTPKEIDEWAASPANAEGLPSIASRVLTTIVQMLVRLEQPEASHLYREGLVNILEQPEFRDPEKMQRLLELFEQPDMWSSILPSILQQEGVQVIIGDQGLGVGMSPYSVVLARYGLEDRLTGVLGVFGPTRMPYSRSVSAVSYVSQLLSSLLQQAYNPRPRGEG